MNNKQQKMNINRHNYETFFLLYVDNELSVTERKIVNIFVQENPDLQRELQLLQQTVLKADDIVLEKKGWLYMEEDISSLQESLLLYADDELISIEKKAVETLLATDRAALAEWQILQQTKIQPDVSIVFADKQSLYRTTGGKVVGFKWWRVAAAAVLLGIALWTGVSVYKNNFKKTPATEPIANNNKINSGEKTTIIQESKNIIEPPAKENTAVQNNTTALAQKNQSVQPAQNYVQPFKKINNENTSEQKDNIAIKGNNNKPGNNLPPPLPARPDKPYFENINRKESNEIVRTNVIPENSINTNISGANNGIVKTNSVNDNINRGNRNPNTNTAMQVVNKTTADGNNCYMDLDDGKGKRTMFGGFLRKAKRMVERTTNIKTGDGLKVAGFEIALK